MLAALLLAAACDDGANAATPAVEQAPAASPEAATPAPSPAPAAIREEWLVWFDTGSGVRTRWYTTTDAGTVATKERAALVVSDGEGLWHVRRADKAVDVFSCPCLEDEKDPMCERHGRVTTLGLEAIPADGGVPVPLESASTDTVYGEVDAMTLQVLGGVGPRLLVATSDAGFYCGAHGSYGGKTQLRDPSVAEPPKWPALDLPDPLLREAVVQGDMLAQYQDCWDQPDVGIGTFMHEMLRIASVSVRLDRGLIKLLWQAEADGPYVCTGDYAFHGQVESTLLPQAGALGLAPPLSGGLKAALADVGTAKAVGWSKLERDGEARTEGLAWFSGLDETPWPPSHVEQEPAPSDAAAVPPKGGPKKLLETGRTLTRKKDYVGAVRVLSEAIAADPTAPRPYAARGYAHLLAGDVKAARADCEKVLTFDIDARFEASVHYNLGQVAEREEKPSLAKASYQRSLALREHATVRAALDRLK